MSTPWRKMQQELIDTVKDRKVILMVSGGPDSMFLLDFVHTAGLQNFDVLHFRHGIRENDYLDQQLIENYIIEHAIPCNFVVGYGEGLFGHTKNLENAARTQRWEFVRQHTLADPKPVYVLTAHHLNDNIEQVFIDVMRGTRHSKLGMRKYVHADPSYIKYKPFLNIPKSVILTQCQKRNIEYIHDVTNDDIHHERNWLRNVIIPQLMARRNLEKSMAKSLEMVDDAEEE